jgi:hypothetical protein
MTWLKLKDLKGGPEAIKLYEEMENIILTGPHMPWRDYTESNAKAAVVSEKLHCCLQQVIENNKLDTTKEWILTPPDSMLDNEFGLRNW